MSNHCYHHHYEHKSASASFWIDLALLTGPSAMCLELQAHMQKCVGQSEDHTQPFSTVKEKFLCDVEKVSS